MSTYCWARHFLCGFFHWFLHISNRIYVDIKEIPEKYWQTRSYISKASELMKYWRLIPQLNRLNVVAEDLFTFSSAGFSQQRMYACGLQSGQCTFRLIGSLSSLNCDRMSSRFVHPVCRIWNFERLRSQLSVNCNGFCYELWISILYIRNSPWFV